VHRGHDRAREGTEVARGDGHDGHEHLGVVRGGNDIEDGD